MWPSTLIEIGGMSKLNPFAILMQYGENYAYKHADAVVSLPSHSKDYMVKHGLQGDKFHHIPNGVVIDEWTNPEVLPEGHRIILEELKNKNKFILGYFGGHALSNCLMTLIQSAEQIRDEEIHFVLVGDGMEKESLIQYVHNNEINNVTFLPSVNKKAIPTLTEFFDSIYIGTKNSPLYRFGVCMNKMFDAMMAGKPIIFAIDAPPTPVEEAHCGLIVQPECERAISEAIIQLKNMTSKARQIMGERGRERVLHQYTYKKLAEEFISVMKQK